MLENDDASDTTAEEVDHKVADGGEPAGSAAAEPSDQATVETTGADTANAEGSPEPIENESADSSSTTSNTTPQAANQPIDWQAKLREMEAWNNKILQRTQRVEHEYQQLQQQYQGIDPNLVRSWQQAQAEAQQRNLKRWDRRHPEHSAFRTLLDRAHTVDRQLQAIDRNLPPETQAQLQQAILSALTEQEQQELQSYRAEARNFQTSLMTDPRGTLAPIVQEEIRAALEHERRAMMAQQAVEKDLSHPALARLAEDPNANQRMSQIMRGLSTGEINPWQIAKHIALLESAVGGLQSRVGEADKAKAQAAAQRQLLEKSAAHTRDQAARPAASIFREARRIADERKIPRGDPRFMQIVRELEAKMNHS